MAFRPVDASVKFPALEAEIGQFWKKRQDLRKIARAAGRRAAVRLLRRPADGQRHAAPRPLPHAGHQRPVSRATARCAATSASAKPAGTRTACRSKSKSAKSSASTPRKRSKPTASSRSSRSARKASGATCSEWERLTERIGFWVDLDDAYVTYHQSYVESVWWALKNLFDRGLLYQGHKIVWWWAQGGTALSARRSRPRLSRSGRSERVRAVSAGRRRRQDDRHSLLVWTTTPWTLPSNQFAAVHPDLEYAVVWTKPTAGKLIVAAALVENDCRPKSADESLKVGRHSQGSDTDRPALRAAVRLLLHDAGRTRPARCEPAGRSTLPGESWRRRFRHDRQRHRHRSSSAGVRRSRLRRAASTSKRGS